MIGASNLPSRSVLLGGLSLGAAAGVPRFAWSQGTSDLVLLNGRMPTLDPIKPEVSALAIRDGLIVASGGDDEVRDVLPGADEIDLRGRRVIPGLNDSHLHATRGARYYALELRWDGVRSLARGLDMIRDQATRTPSGQWVRVLGGWSQHQFDERRLPTPADLTEAAPDVPVFVLYLHSRAFLNDAGARDAGLTREGAAESQGTPGRYEITKDGGAILYAEPTSGSMNRIIGELPGVDAAAERVSARHFYRELARFGLTSVGDLAGGGHTYPDAYAATLAMTEAGEMTMRISNFLPPHDSGRELEILQVLTDRYALNVNLAEELSHAFTLEGTGEAIDLSFYDFENFMAPRPDLPPVGERDAELTEIVRHLMSERWPIRIHATSDETISRLMDIFEAAHAAERDAGRSGFSGIRWAVEHAETIGPATLARVAALGGGIAVQDRMAFAGELFADRYGTEAAAEAAPLADIVAAGVPLGLGTDGTRVASFNPWVALQWAITGKTAGGAALMAPRHRRSRLEALYHYTIGSAWFSGDEARKGWLAPGQYADLAVLDRDVFGVTDDDIAGTQSLLTITCGRVAYANGDYADLAPSLPPIEPNGLRSLPSADTSHETYQSWRTKMKTAFLALGLALAPLSATAQSSLVNGIEAAGVTTQTAADHLAIIELSNLFENAFDEGDIEAHMATWAEEMSFVSPFGSYEDRPSYEEWVTGFFQQMNGMGGTRHLITNAVISVDGDRATQTCYLVILGRTMDDGGPALMATVRFEDELVRTDAGWRFERRELVLDQDPAMFTGN